ncbi:MAG: sulfatase/phosphatase domain-containing protein [Tepidisphaeraceae bacterium]
MTWSHINSPSSSSFSRQSTRSLEDFELTPASRSASFVQWRGRSAWRRREKRVASRFFARTDRYKLIHYYTVNEWELFDLKTDPQEMKSVYGDPAHADARKELEAELKRLQQQYKDTDPTRNVSPRH